MGEDADDAARFTRLYHDCYDRVLAYTLARVPPEQAVDATAETFLVAWRRLPDIPQYALPWLLVTARHTLSQQRRAGLRAAALVGELSRVALVSGGATGDVADAVVERQVVLHAVGSLSESDREALILTVWDGLSTRDAAAVVGCSAAAYALRLHRARRRLARALAAGDDPADRVGVADAAGAQSLATGAAS